jgi:hypothetical protein
MCFLFEEGDAEFMGERMMLLTENLKLQVQLANVGRVHAEKIGHMKISFAKLRFLLLAPQQKQRIA